MKVFYSFSIHLHVIIPAPPAQPNLGEVGLDFEASLFSSIKW